MRFLSTGKYKPVNGMLKIVVNGKQKIQIDSSITLRRPRMIKKWIIRPLKKFWNFLSKNDNER
jgi:hypothetical protein